MRKTPCLSGNVKLAALHIHRQRHSVGPRRRGHLGHRCHALAHPFQQQRYLIRSIAVMDRIDRQHPHPALYEILDLRLQALPGCADKVPSCTTAPRTRQPAPPPEHYASSIDFPGVPARSHPSTHSAPTAASPQTPAQRRTTFPSQGSTKTHTESLSCPRYTRSTGISTGI